MTVFFDIDTQLDFVNPSGALYVPGAEAILPAVAKLNQYAAAQGIPVISTTDAHGEDDPEFNDWPPHCVAGTIGQQKPAATMLGRRAVVSTPSGIPEIGDAQQIIVEKQQLDCFTNPNLPALLDRLGAERCVVYGVVTEFCVRCAAVGLLERGRQVEVVEDAIRTLDEEESRRTLEEILEAGGKVTTAGAIS